jgi:hypothetical protein
MFRIEIFTNKVRAVNPHFERIIHSSLHQLMKLLKQPNASPAEVLEALGRLKGDKTAKYDDAIAYLRKEFAWGVPADAVPTGAVPVDFKHRFGRYSGSGQSFAGYDLSNLAKPPQHITGLTKHHFIFTCTWQSSDGNLGSLARVYSREHCTYRCRPTQPPSPMNHIYERFEQLHPNLSFAQPEVAGNMMSNGTNDDDHSTSDLRVLLAHPRREGDLVIDQKYQYSIKPTDPNSWIDIPNGGFIITRRIRKKGTKWTFQFIKESSPGNRRPFKYESKPMEIADRPPVMPRTLTDITL